MLSRSGSSRLGLVCSDCGTPTPLRVEQGRPHPVVTGLTLVSMAAFALLLFFLTNWRPLPAQQAASQRAMIKQITTGAFAREPELIDKGAQGE
jgi:hypothetical protein